MFAPGSGSAAEATAAALLPPSASPRTRKLHATGLSFERDVVAAAPGVFVHKKYRPAWDLLEKLPDGPRHIKGITELGLRFRDRWTEFLASTVAHCFNAGRTQFHLDVFLWELGDEPPSETMRRQFESMIRNEAADLVEVCAAAADAAFQHFVADEIAPLPESTAPVAGPCDPATGKVVQPVPAEFVGKHCSLHTECVRYTDMVPGTKTVIDQVLALITGHVADLGSVKSLVAEEDFQGLAAMAMAGALGDRGSAPHFANAEDGYLLWCILAAHPSVSDEGDGAYCSHLTFLYAQHLLLSKDFHADMRELLAEFGEFVAAILKGESRGAAKCDDDDDGYANDSRPQSKHLKDILRCTLYVANNTQLQAARAKLVARYGDHGCKDRRNAEPKDVLQVVRYKGMLVEVQFHFAAVAAAKKFSHAAYNVARCNPSGQAHWMASMTSLFDLVRLAAFPEVKRVPDDEIYDRVLTPAEFKATAKLVF